jgi:hypothetical protein
MPALEFNAAPTRNPMTAPIRTGAVPSSIWDV